MRRSERSKEEIRAEARQSLLRVYERRDELVRQGATIEDVLPNAAELIARVHEFEIVRLRELPTQSIEGRVFAESETAGIIDRDSRRIFVATRFPLRTQRFTLAHEIGHLVLHPLDRYHRDRPLVGGERSNVPKVEREADIFAAELLMPEKYLRTLFEQRFGGPIDGAHASDNLAFNLSLGTRRKVSASQLVGMTRFDRALLFARCDAWGGRMFQSLVDGFNVSSRAMAWQLCDHELIL